jgi:HEAT repeat protein
MEADQINKKTEAGPAQADVFETLAEALTHDDPAVRRSATGELGRRKEKRATNLLVEALIDKDSSVRLEAATALQELGWRPANDVFHARQAVATRQFETAAGIGDPAVDPLLLCLGEQDAGLRMAALETLAQIGGTRVLKPITEVLQDENPHMRAVAVQALCKLGDPQSIEPIAKLVRDSSWEVRAIVLDALATFSSPKCIPPLICFARDELADVRLRAVELLGKTADIKAAPSLITATIDENIAVRLAAKTALRAIDPAWFKSEHARSAMPELLAALKHEDDFIRKAAADTLRDIGQTTAMNSYLTAEVGSAPKSAMTVLSRSLKSDNRDLRQAAAEALGRLADTSAIPYLVEALRDNDSVVREAAVYSLNLLNWKPANDTEVVLRSVILQRWDSVAAFDAIALEPLIMALESDDPTVCKSAIETLGRIGDRSATDPLVVMLGHPKKMVRIAAAQALRLMGWQPSDIEQGVSLAIELGDWDSVTGMGEPAVLPLISQLKENQQDREFAEAAISALAKISDPRAATTLVAHARDGQISEAVILALTNLVEQSASEIETDALVAMAGLNNLFQFRYTFDARYGTFVRSGLQEVDSLTLKKGAKQELARRGVEA